MIWDALFILAVVSLLLALIGAIAVNELGKDHDELAARVGRLEGRPTFTPDLGKTKETTP